MKQFSPPNAITEILRRLTQAGYQSYLVGGCVRDGLLGLTPHDWDICTDALPEAVQALFPGSLNYGMKHGTVTVRNRETMAEVTTFRSEGAYSDHRRPDQVTFISDLRADLARRDFTVNAIAMDAEGVLHDPFGGQQDLKSRVIRAVGTAEERFSEDALRMLRAVRFSAQLGFSIEEKTGRAIAHCAPLVSSLAAERVCAELEKTLLTPHPELAVTMSEANLLAPWGICGPLGDAGWLSSLAPERLKRWAGFSLLLSSVDALRALRLDGSALHVCEAVRELLSARPRTEIEWKAAISAYGKERALTAAEVFTAMDGGDDLDALQTIMRRGDSCTIGELAIGGNDLKALGLRGRQIGTALHAALRRVWEHPEDNTAEALTSWIRREMNTDGGFLGSSESGL